MGVSSSPPTTFPALADSAYISVRSFMMRPSSSKVTQEGLDQSQVVGRKMAHSCDGGGVTYFSGLFSARVTDGDAPDTQDLVGFGENWKK